MIDGRWDDGAGPFPLISISGPVEADLPIERERALTSFR